MGFLDAPACRFQPSLHPSAVATDAGQRDRCGGLLRLSRQRPGEVGFAPRVAVRRQLGANLDGQFIQLPTSNLDPANDVQQLGAELIGWRVSTGGDRFLQHAWAVRTTVNFQRAALREKNPGGKPGNARRVRLT